MKHFEEEYRKYVHENTPDLWNRIEAGLAEKTEEHVQTTTNKVPDNWQIIENRLQEKTTEVSASQTQKRKPQYYLRGILTAAAGFFVIATAAITLNMRQKSAEEAKNASTVYEAEKAAYDSEPQQPAEAADNAPAQSLNAPTPAAEYDMAEETTTAITEYEMAEEAAPEYEMAEESAAEYDIAGEAATEYEMAEEAIAENETAEETTAEYNFQYAPAEAPKDVYAETGETQDFISYEHTDNISAEETAAYSEEDMIESEEMPVYAEEDADVAEPEVAMSLIAPVPVKELGIALSIPPTMTAQSLSTEEEKQGYICEYAGTFADISTPATLTIRYIETEAETLDEYKKIIEEDDTATDIKSASYSGIDFLEYTRADKYCMLYYAENGTPVELSMTPAAPESVKILQSVIKTADE